MAEPEMRIPDAWIEAGCSASKMHPKFVKQVLRAVLPLALAPARDALGDLLSSLVVEDEEGLIEHAEPMRAARKARDDIVKVIGG